jgi:hypothetical protein
MQHNVKLTFASRGTTAADEGEEANAPACTSSRDDHRSRDDFAGRPR